MDIERIIELNEGLIKKIANKFYGVPKEDLYQAGRLGIKKAYDNYKKEGTTKFSSYAYKYILGEMYDLVLKEQQMKVSKDYLKLYSLIEKTRSILSQKLGRIATNLDVALYLEIDLEIVNNVNLIFNNITSLDDYSEDDRSLYETIEANNNENIDDKIFIEECMSVLNPEEAKIINYRYYEDLTQAEVAEKLNMNQTKVSRFESKSLEKMRKFSKAA